MPFVFVLALSVFGALAALLAVMNAVQVCLGRQFVKPSASRRSPRQLRAESAAAAVAMLGASVTAFGFLAGDMWPAAGALVLLPGWIALAVVRRHFAAVGADAAVIGRTSVDPE
ncbi:hypothetical protein OG426_07150 [Streptomyces canus]|uniref:hypothetical protein n=1 Tax=Streptomyces canus TaxID=58343 RepID=UPI002259591B|nr:hypothetical protein [Streptomyces canus]MCX4852510.1 hypothetical protein [Streptomyces canus]WSW32282.1 hypothetical protein OG426_07150 [Streptomyces canus]